MGLWDKVKERRKQSHRDSTQDDEIKQLRSRVDTFEAKSSRGRSRSRSVSDAPSRDEVGTSFQNSGALIRREFDDGVERYGQQFAVGDVVTENKLQAQVISLQQTVINVLQDAVYHGRQLDRIDMAKLVAASNAARNGSIDALREQRQRLLAATEIGGMRQQPLAIEPPAVRPPSEVFMRSPTVVDAGRYAPSEYSTRGLPAIEPPSRFQPTEYTSRAPPPPATQVSTRAHPGTDMMTRPPPSIEPPSRSSSSTAVEARPLYCRYSLDLQYRNKPLAASFAPGRKCACPGCGVRLAAAADDVYAIAKRTSRWVSDGRYEREIVEETEFLVGQRFVVKSHTADGEYACILCTKYRDGDVVCPTVDILVNHIGKAHDIKELDQEPDFEVRTRPMQKALPPA